MLDPTEKTSLEDIGWRIEDVVVEENIDVVIVDSLGQAMRGDGDRGQDASIGLRSGLNGARAAGAAVLVIDHATKKERVSGRYAPTPSGSQQKRAWARLTIALEEENDGTIRWTVDKSNTAKFVPFLTKLHFQRDNSDQIDSIKLEHIGEAGERSSESESRLEIEKEKILQIICDKEGQAERKDFGSGGTVNRALSELMHDKHIKRIDRGKYALSDPTPSVQPLGIGWMENY